MQLENEFHEQKMQLGAARIRSRNLESQIDDLEGQLYVLNEEKDEAIGAAANEAERLKAAAAKSV